MQNHARCSEQSNRLLSTFGHHSREHLGFAESAGRAEEDSQKSPGTGHGEQDETDGSAKRQDDKQRRPNRIRTAMGAVFKQYGAAGCRYEKIFGNWAGFPIEAPHQAPYPDGDDWQYHHRRRQSYERTEYEVRGG